MTKPIPDGCEGLIPHLVVKGATEALEFYKNAFGAEVLHVHNAPGDDRVMHAALTIGGRPVYLCDDFPEYCGGKARNPVALAGTPVTIHQYVRDVDAAVAKAQKAGAKVTMPPQDMFWGDRYAVTEDPFGHAWSFATHIKDMSPEEMEEAASKAFS